LKIATVMHIGCVPFPISLTTQQSASTQARHYQHQHSSPSATGRAKANRPTPANCSP
jgi:hypothetical protein